MTIASPATEAATVADCGSSASTCAGWSSGGPSIDSAVSRRARALRSTVAAERLNHVAVMEKQLRRIIELKPDYAHAYNALGYSLADRNLRLPEALQLIEKARELAPDDAFILDSLGWVHFRLGDLKLAREHLQRAYDARPDAEVAVHLAEVLWASGEQDGARKLLREARAKEPANPLLKSTVTRLKIGL